MEAAFADARLSHLACRLIGVLLTRYCNREIFKQSGRLEAWPGRKTLAAETGSTPDGVRKAALQLQLAGYLEIKPGLGRGNTSRFLLGKSQTTAAVLGAESQNVPPPLGAQKSDVGHLKSQTPAVTNPLKPEPSWIPEEVRGAIAHGGKGRTWADALLANCDWCADERVLITSEATAKALMRDANAGIRLAEVRIEVRPSMARRA